MEKTKLTLHWADLCEPWLRLFSHFPPWTQWNGSLPALRGSWRCSSDSSCDRKIPAPRLDVPEIGREGLGRHGEARNVVNSGNERWQVDPSQTRSAQTASSFCRQTEASTLLAADVTVSTSLLPLLFSSASCSSATTISKLLFSPEIAGGSKTRARIWDRAFHTLPVADETVPCSLQQNLSLRVTLVGAALSNSITHLIGSQRKSKIFWPLPGRIIQLQTSTESFGKCRVLMRYWKSVKWGSAHMRASLPHTWTQRRQEHRADLFLMSFLFWYLSAEVRNFWDTVVK